jgi:hypothetical protein
MPGPEPGTTALFEIRHAVGLIESTAFGVHSVEGPAPKCHLLVRVESAGAKLLPKGRTRFDRPPLLSISYGP